MRPNLKSMGSVKEAIYIGSVLAFPDCNKIPEIII